MLNLSHRYDSVVALDMDGVVADTLHGGIRYKYPKSRDPRVTAFIENNPNLFTSSLNGLGKYDVEGVLVDSLIILCELMIKSNSCMVLVSSWISCPDTYKHVEYMIRELTGLPREEPFLIGQIKSGGGGTYREIDFLKWCQSNLNPEEVMSISAVDDSGPRHFPLLETLNQLVAPNGRCGFTADNYIALTNKLGFYCEDWSIWLEDCGDTWLKDSGKPKLSKKCFWDIVFKFEDSKHLESLIKQKLKRVEK